MNKTSRQGIFFGAIFVVMSVGTYLLGWTVYQCLMLLAFMGLIMKLTDIEEAIENK